MFRICTRSRVRFWTFAPTETLAPQWTSLFDSWFHRNYLCQRRANLCFRWTWHWHFVITARYTSPMSYSSAFLSFLHTNRRKQTLMRSPFDRLRRVGRHGKRRHSTISFYLKYIREIDGKINYCRSGQRPCIQSDETRKHFFSVGHLLSHQVRVTLRVYLLWLQKKAGSFLCIIYFSLTQDFIVMQVGGRRPVYNTTTWLRSDLSFSFILLMLLVSHWEHHFLLNFREFCSFSRHKQMFPSDSSSALLARLVLALL